MTLYTFFLFLFATLIPSIVGAAAWWGEGYRPPAWVLSHGGTIIRYTIHNGNPDKYKAIMYRNGAYVEIEFGKKAIFDDAKNGLYTIVFYKCHESCRHHKFHKKQKLRSKDKKVAQLSVYARPGETIDISFNAKAKRATIISRSTHAHQNTRTSNQKRDILSLKGRTQPIHPDNTSNKSTPHSTTHVLQQHTFPHIILTSK